MPTHLRFTNGNLSEPYSCKWTLMRNTPSYTIPKEITLAQELAFKVCMNCKTIGCSPDSDTCKTRKSRAKKEERKYWDKKSKKVEREEDLIEKAKKKREELNTSGHPMLSKIIKKKRA